MDDIDIMQILDKQIRVFALIKRSSQLQACYQRFATVFEKEDKTKDKVNSNKKNKKVLTSSLQRLLKKFKKDYLNK